MCFLTLRLSTRRIKPRLALDQGVKGRLEDGRLVLSRNDGWDFECCFDAEKAGLSGPAAGLS